MTDARGENLHELVDLMRTLLSPEGCPWDREQTLQTLRPYVIEEAHEVADAIDREDPAALKEELGDLLLQIVFQSELTRRKGWFGLNDVVDVIVQKMIRRHPWVFGDEGVDDADGALDRWEAIKAEEKAAKGDRPKGALEGVPVGLPALLRAVRVGEKASAVGYDWPDAGGPRAKIDEELAELDAALEAGDPAAAEAELGDLLFSIASFARKRDLDPEAALRVALNRFSDRFEHAEASAASKGQTLRELDEAALDALWEDAKRALRGDRGDG